jgi:hypothetical protein
VRNHIVGAVISLRAIQQVTGPELNRQSLQARIWPPMPALAAPPLSLRALAQRFAAPASAFDGFLKSSAPKRWKNVPKADLLEGLRVRLLDPAVMHQRDTMMCGPVTLMFEFARRRPALYIEFVRSLFETGRYTAAKGRQFKVDQDVLDGAMPGPDDANVVMSPADWLPAISLRDDENWFWDVDGDKSKSGLAGGLTTVAEMAAWTRDLLGLQTKVDRPELGFIGEEGMILRAAKVVEKGGVALLCIDGALLKKGDGDDEEDVAFQRTPHLPSGIGPTGKLVHSKDDFLTATHWVAMLDGLMVNNDRFTARLWSWGGEYTLKGSLSSFGEYLHAVVLGEP